MDQDKAKLKVVLDRKKTELKKITARVARAEAARSRSPLQTASVLVRSSLHTQDPIWVDGLDYPAQYLVRTTRSMSASQQILPTLRVPLGVVDFDLPDTLLAHRPAVQTVKQGCPFTVPSNREGLPLALCSVLRVGVWDHGDRLGKLLQTQHKHCTHIAIVLPRDISLLTQQPRLALKWRDHLPQNGVSSCGAMCSDTAEWLLVVVGGDGWGVRVYLDGPCGRTDLRLIVDSEPLGGVCAWSNRVSSFEVAVGSSSGVLLWHLELSADNIWTSTSVADVCSPVTTPCSSLVHVAETERCVAGTTGPTLILWDSCVVSEYPLTCAPLDASVSVVWARREESHTFVVLCMPGVCVLAVVKDGVRLLNSICVENLRSVRCSDGLLHMLSEDVLSVLALGANEPLLQLTVSGCRVADCVWINNKHLVWICCTCYITVRKEIPQPHNKIPPPPG